MLLEDARRLAKIEADKHGFQFIVTEDAIGNTTDFDQTPFGFITTLAMPIFITTLKYGKIVEVIEPATSAPERRKDLEDGLVALFRRDPNLVKRD